MSERGLNPEVLKYHLEEEGLAWRVTLTLSCGHQQHHDFTFAGSGRGFRGWYKGRQRALKFMLATPFTACLACAG